MAELLCAGCQQPQYCREHGCIQPSHELPLDPTQEMIEAGAQRLVSWEDGCVWPTSWDSLQVSAARNEAERVWRSMWVQGVTALLTSSPRAHSKSQYKRFAVQGAGPVERNDCDYLRSLVRMDIRKKERALEGFAPKPGQPSDEAQAVRKKFEEGLAYKRGVLERLGK